MHKIVEIEDTTDVEIDVNEKSVSVSTDVRLKIDIFELMDDELDEDEVVEYCESRDIKIPSDEVEVRSINFEKELAHDYLRYNFDLVKLVQEIGIDEVQRIIDELKK